MKKNIQIKYKVLYTVTMIYVQLASRISRYQHVRGFTSQNIYKQYSLFAAAKYTDVQKIKYTHPPPLLWKLRYAVSVVLLINRIHVFDWYSAIAFATAVLPLLAKIKNVTIVESKILVINFQKL